MKVTLTLDYEQLLELRVHLNAARRSYERTASRCFNAKDIEFIEKLITEVVELLNELLNYSIVSDEKGGDTE